MTRIVVDHGSWGFAGMTFYAGATPCEDESVIKAAEEGPGLVHVERDDSVELAPATKIAAALPESGMTKLEDITPEGGKFSCREGCDERFNSFKDRATHERIYHSTSEAMKV